MGEEGTEGEWRGRGGEEEDEGSAVYSCLALASEPHFPKWEMSPYCLGLPRRLTRPCSIALGLVPAVGFNKWLLLLLIISTLHSFRKKKLNFNHHSQFIFSLSHVYKNKSPLVMYLLVRREKKAGHCLFPCFPEPHTHRSFDLVQLCSETELWGPGRWNALPGTVR